MSDPRALVVSYHTPQPDRDSGSRRVFHFIELLQEEGWDVVVLAADGVGAEQDAWTLRQRGIPVYDGYATPIEEVLASGSFALALVAYWPNAERYLPRIRSLSPGTRVIVDSVDLHFVRESREMLRTASTPRPHGLTEAHGSRFAAELNSYASADGVLTVSQKEADLVNGLLWDPDLAQAVPDCEPIAAAFEPFSRRRGVLAIGSFEHAPNIEAVGHLCRDILPLIDPQLLAEHPVWIVGNQLGDDVRRFARGLEHVHMVGWVPSVLPYLGRARVSVVPLLYGAGTKRKLVQALSTGTATVSTTIGVEGLALRHGEHVLVADDPREFAAAVTTLLTDGKLWTRLARAGRKHVRGTNGRELAQSRFKAALELVSERAPKRVTTFPHAVSQARVTPDEYERLVHHLREKLPELIRPGGSVLVVSKGDDRLLQLGNCSAGHFPQDETGRWAGYHPKDSAAAIDHLETLRSRGAEAIVFPRTSFWWLEHYRELAEHLEREGGLLHREDDCEIFSLGSREGDGSAARPSVARIDTAPDSPQSHTNDEVRLIAFYLPQFHPIPENDAWWGRGLHRVAQRCARRAALPRPLPAARAGRSRLLRPPAARRHGSAQAELARAHGIHGFCYYHYWFSSKRLLERPFDEVLASGEPDFPFALCWANDPWSRRWDGRTDDLLQPQEYSPEDDLAHIRSLLPALGDARAITVAGKPLFLVYRASHLPDAAPDRARRGGRRSSEPGCRASTSSRSRRRWDLGWDATQVGFDAKVLFQPQFGWLMTHVATTVRPSSRRGKGRLAGIRLRRGAPCRRPTRVGRATCATRPSARAGTTRRASETRGVVLNNSTPSGTKPGYAPRSRVQALSRERSGSCSSMRGTSGPKAATSSRTSATVTGISTPHAAPARWPLRTGTPRELLSTGVYQRRSMRLIDAQRTHGHFRRLPVSTQEQ